MQGSDKSSSDSANESDFEDKKDMQLYTDLNNIRYHDYEYVVNRRSDFVPTQEE